MKRLLVVDDDVRNLQILENLLKEENYQVFLAKDAEGALTTLAQTAIDLILLDIVMPQVDGFEICRMLKEKEDTGNIPVIFITGRRDTDSIARGFELGASDYIPKPFSAVELLARIKTHLKLKDYQENLEKLVRERTRELEREIRQRVRFEKDLESTNSKLRRLMQDNLHLLASVVELRDPFTAGHQENVTRLAARIAQDLKLDQDMIDGITVAAMIHDIGKIKVPLEILTKGGKLLDLEMEIVKIHPRVGYELLKDIEFPWPVAETVLQHHERLDGSGYPTGLKAAEIIYPAQVLAVADVVEAITYHRPYRAGLGLETALEEIKQNQNTLYDPQIVQSCLELFRSGDFQF